MASSTPKVGKPAKPPRDSAMMKRPASAMKKAAPLRSVKRSPRVSAANSRRKSGVKALVNAATGGGIPCCCPK